MKARLPKSYASLPPAEKKAIYAAVCTDVARKAAVIATQLAENEAKRRTALTIECCTNAALIAIVDEFHVGTDATKLGKRQSKLQRFADAMHNVLTEAGDRYDECMIEGLRWQAQQRGIEVDPADLSACKTNEELFEEIKKGLQAPEKEEEHHD